MVFLVWCEESLFLQRDFLKILILGRGFAGLSLAWELIHRGHKVVVVGHGVSSYSSEHNRHPASCAAVGVSSLKGHFLADSALFAAKLASHHGLESWLQGIEVFSKRHIPRFKGSVFEPFFNCREFQYLHERIFHGNPTGLYRNRIVDSKEFREKISLEWKEAHPLGAFEYYNDLWFDPAVCLEALEKAIRSKGGQIIDGLLNGISLQVQQNSKAKSQEEKNILKCAIQLLMGTESMFCETQHMVLACGSYLNDVLFKLDAGFSLPVSLCSGSTLTYKSTYNNYSSWGLRIKKTNFIFSNSQVIVGSSSFNHDIGRHSLLEGLIPKSGFEEYKMTKDEQLAHVVGEEVKLSRFQWGARLKAKDRSPIIGSLVQLANNVSMAFPKEILPKIWIFSGLYKNGLQVAWWLAKNLSDEIEGQKNKIVMQDFSIKRLFGS